jgi:hypothetical protein
MLVVSITMYTCRSQNYHKKNVHREEDTKNILIVSITHVILPVEMQQVKMNDIIK